KGHSEPKAGIGVRFCVQIMLLCIMASASEKGTRKMRGDAGTNLSPRRNQFVEQGLLPQEDSKKDFLHCAFCTAIVQFPRRLGRFSPRKDARTSKADSV